MVFAVMSRFFRLDTRVKKGTYDARRKETTPAVFLISNIAAQELFSCYSNNPLHYRGLPPTYPSPGCSNLQCVFFSFLHNSSPVFAKNKKKKRNRTELGVFHILFTLFEWALCRLGVAAALLYFTLIISSVPSRGSALSALWQWQRQWSPLPEGQQRRRRRHLAHVNGCIGLWARLVWTLDCV